MNKIIYFLSTTPPLYLEYNFVRYSSDEFVHLLVIAGCIIKNNTLAYFVHHFKSLRDQMGNVKSAEEKGSVFEEERGDVEEEDIVFAPTWTTVAVATSTPTKMSSSASCRKSVMRKVEEFPSFEEQPGEGILLDDVTESSAPGGAHHSREDGCTTTALIHSTGDDPSCARFPGGKRESSVEISCPSLATSRQPICCDKIPKIIKISMKKVRSHHRKFGQKRYLSPEVKKALTINGQFANYNLKRGTEYQVHLDDEMDPKDFILTDLPEGGPDSKVVPSVWESTVFSYRPTSEDCLQKKKFMTVIPNENWPSIMYYQSKKHKYTGGALVLR